MTDLPELLAQTASALVGTVAGGAIALYVARWQTLRTAEIQARTTTAQENAAVQLAHSLRVHEREKTAARALLERLEGLYQWSPSLPDVAEARNYLRHVQHTLESVIDGAPLPRHAAPPRPDRPGDEAWLPPDLPPHWTDPADGS
ncbi:hypothetical protein ACP4TB_05340 [Streptomyces sp. DR3-1]|uniref:hypothetical protein n=1 Tax=Streptomyces sp. DR3-1 TaxID=2951169 RepID=UPI002043B4FA|nr:hypothetical protein [Streptomyces sp. DR3-1]MCM3817694.1 hypothetical protein [Streptomyces sp. DR3-1]